MPAGIAHGGRLIEAARRYPQAPRPFLDLSTGISPFPYPLPALPVTAFTRLPEPEELLALQQAAAASYGASDPAMVAAAPGTQSLISLLPRLLGLRRATILGPTYGGHQAAWREASLRIEHDQARFAEAAGRDGGAAILCNPNNPDGRRRDPDWLLALADTMARRGGVLIVDEAFADLEDDDPGLARQLPAAGLLILRSFGKSYGLAGLRLGFLLAAPGTAARVREALGGWPVSGPALVAGRVALADPGWRDAMRPLLQVACNRLDRVFADAGFALQGGTRLFRLYRGEHAQMAFHRLAAQGVLTRRFDEDAGLLRVGLPGSEAAWTRLSSALPAAIARS